MSEWCKVREGSEGAEQQKLLRSCNVRGELKGERPCSQLSSKDVSDCQEVVEKARASRSSRLDPKNTPRDRRKRDSLFAHRVTRHRHKTDAARDAW